MSDYIVQEKHLIKAVTEQIDQPGIRIVQRKDSPACDSGENYDFVVTVHDVKAELGNSEIVKCQFVSKCLPFDDLEKVKRLLKDFITEVFIYEKVLAFIGRERKAYGLPELSVPKCYLSSLSDQVIIMDNIKQYGFRMRNASTEPLTLQEVKAAISTVASFHASSYHYLLSNQDHELQEKLNGWLFENGNYNDLIALLLQATFDIYRRETEKSTNICDLDEMKVNNFLSHWRSLTSKIDRQKGDFEAIILDDYWYNNILFRSRDNDDDEIDACMLDFQTCRIGTPILDLTHFMCTSVDASIRQGSIKEILDYYFDTLTSDLGHFGHKVNFSKEDLLSDYNDAFSLGFVYGIMQSHLDNIGQEDEIEWSEYFCDFDAADKGVILLDKITQKAKSVEMYRKRIIYLVEEFMAA